MLGLLLATLAQAASPPAAAAPQPPLPPLHGGPATMTCAVGGETFSAWRPTMYSTFGQRPDGRPYSYLPFPLPLPECPGNRLVMFDAFTPAETARLPALIASSGYRALLAADDTPYYRAYWLAAKLGRPADDVLWLLLCATWEVKGGTLSPSATPARLAKARAYQEEFVRLARKLPADVPAKARSWVDLRAANALRELGRFEAAEAMRRTALAATGDADPGNAAFLAKLGPVIARRDSSLEPLDLIPDQQARFVCATPPPTMSVADRARCATPPLSDDAARLRNRDAIGKAAPKGNM